MVLLSFPNGWASRQRNEGSPPRLVRRDRKKGRKNALTLDQGSSRAKQTSLRSSVASQQWVMAFTIQAKPRTAKLGSSRRYRSGLTGAPNPWRRCAKTPALGTIASNCRAAGLFRARQFSHLPHSCKRLGLRAEILLHWVSIYLIVVSATLHGTRRGHHDDRILGQ